MGQGLELAVVWSKDSCPVSGCWLGLLLSLRKEDLKLPLWSRVLKDERPIVPMLGEGTHP